MITPNKFVTYRDSALARLPRLLMQLEKPTEIGALYRTSEKRFDSVLDFLHTLDVLFALGRIAVDFTTGVVRRVD